MKEEPADQAQALLEALLKKREETPDSENVPEENE
jgi:hypothetical protein